VREAEKSPSTAPGDSQKANHLASLRMTACFY